MQMCTRACSGWLWDVPLPQSYWDALEHSHPGGSSPHSDEMLYASSVNSPPTAHEPCKATKVYHKRWIVLIVYTLCYITNSFLVLTLVPIDTIAVKFFQRPEAWINAVTVSFSVQEVLLLFPVLWGLKVFGLLFSTNAACFMLFLGTWIRYLSVVDYTPELFYLFMAGTVIAGFAQPVYDASASKLVALWFPENERGSALAIVLFGVVGGMGVANIVVPKVVTKPAHMPYLMLFQAGVSTLLLIINLLLFQGRPAAPPALSTAEVETRNAGLSPYKALLEVVYNAINVVINIRFWFIAGALALTIGTLSGWQVVAEELDHDRGYSANDAGNIGAVLNLTGLVGIIASGILLDTIWCFKSHKILLIIGSMGTAGFFVWYALALKPHNITILYIMSAIMSPLITIGYPAAVDAAAEVTFPTSEEYSNSIIVIVQDVVGAILPLIFPVIHKKLGLDYVLWGFVTVSVGGILCAVLFPPKYRRSLFERQQLDPPPAAEHGEKRRLLPSSSSTEEESDAQDHHDEVDGANNSGTLPIDLAKFRSALGGSVFLTTIAGDDAPREH